MRDTVPPLYKVGIRVPLEPPKITPMQCSTWTTTVIVRMFSDAHLACSIGENLALRRVYCSFGLDGSIKTLL